MMNIESAKLDIVQKILSVKTEATIDKINKILEEEMIVGYTAEGKPLTKEAYNNRLKKAEKEIDSGNYITQEGLEEEAANW